MKRLHDRVFPVIVEEDEAGFFVASNPALPGCYSQGKSMEEALANVREATEACLDHRPAEDVSRYIEGLRETAGEAAGTLELTSA
jgi:predicted RNase H-like HicB family nuclease